MTIISCPDCARNVSDRAPACPHCGAPITPTQIEVTAKPMKAGLLVGAVAFAGGLYLLFGGAQAAIGLPVMIGGAAIMAVSWASAWWHHG